MRPERDLIDPTEASSYLRTGLGGGLIIRAGLMLRAYQASGDFEEEQKQGVDFTTQPDKEVDRFLTENLLDRFPQSRFLTEETAETEYAHLKGNYSSLRKVDNLWIIDPCDGTINYARGHSRFAVSVALVQNGDPVLGVVYMPRNFIGADNSPALYWAQADIPTTFLNARLIKVSQTRELREANFALDWPYNLKLREKVVQWAGNLAPHVRQIKCGGSAVADLVNVADGSIDGYANLGLKPWDVAAASLIVEKAGGIITTPTGGEWDIFNPDCFASNRTLRPLFQDLLIS